MKLHKIIEERLATIKLNDKSGNPIEPEQSFREYCIIKNMLLSEFGNGDIVGIKFDKDYKYLLTLLACMSIGLTYIPLSNKWPDERIEQIRTLSGCRVLTEEMFDFHSSNDSISNKVIMNETLYIIFTSGSTGAPKGVKISRGAYLDFLLWSNDYFIGITEDDRALLTTDFTFDISLVDVSLLLSKNIRLYMSNFNNNVFKLLYELESYKITIHSTVPYNYSMIMHEDVFPKADISSLKHIMIGGARFPNNLYANFKKYLPTANIYNFYGPTEATIYCSIHKFNYTKSEVYNNNVTIGRPFYNNRFTIIADELYIAGTQLMSGYLNDELKTSQVLIDIEGTMHYKTGDVVFKSEEGNYFIVGRKDDTVKVTGYRVNLSDIDSYILQLEYINNVATVAIENSVSENDLVSYIISDDSKVEVKKIKRDLKEIMPEYQIPKFIKIVESFPLNNSGKICKLTLKKIFQSEK